MCTQGTALNSAFMAVLELQLASVTPLTILLMRNPYIVLELPPPPFTGNAGWLHHWWSAVYTYMHLLQALGYCSAACCTPP